MCRSVCLTVCSSYLSAASGADGGSERILMNRNSVPCWPRRVCVKNGHALNEMAEPIASTEMIGRVKNAAGTEIARSKSRFFFV